MFHPSGNVVVLGFDIVYQLVLGTPNSIDLKF